MQKGEGRMRALSENRIKELEELCRKFRMDLVTLLHEVQTGHAGGSLSECEILTVLYMECANISPENQKAPDRDRIVLSKGHGAPMLYRCLCEKGFFPEEELHTLRQPGSRLQGHPCSEKTPGVELSTGPLGIGLSASVGMACANRLMGNQAHVFTVLGDGELNEGTVWEAAMSAAKYKCDHLIAIVDWNKVQLDGAAEDIMPMHNMEERWDSFGWNVIRCNGHSVSELYEAIERAKEEKDGKPWVILADTIKGKGVSFMEGTNKYHGKAISDEEYEKAKKELEV